MSEDFEELTEEVMDAQDTLSEPVYDGSPRFAVKRHISSGGLATVFLVEDRQRNGRSLAAKISHHPESEEKVFDFFKRETELLNKVHNPEEHPNVVMLHDSMICSGFPVLFMEYLPKTLNSYIRRVQKKKEEPSEAQVLRFLEDTGNGVKAIHSHDWTHRDIKPSNILLSSDETRVKVADLGSVGHRGTKSSAMSVLIWRAPEVFPDTEKEEHYWTFQSDIYALSVLGVSLLSGKSKPFADDQTTAFQQKNDPKYLSNLVKNLPASQAFRDALRQNLDRDPSKRCRSIDDFISRLKGQGAIEISTRAVSEEGRGMPIVSSARPPKKPSLDQGFMERYQSLEQAVGSAKPEGGSYNVYSADTVAAVLEKRQELQAYAQKKGLAGEHQELLEKAEDAVFAMSERDMEIIRAFCSIIKKVPLTSKDHAELKKKGWANEEQAVTVFSKSLGAWKDFRKPKDLTHDLYQ